MCWLFCGKCGLKEGFLGSQDELELRNSRCRNCGSSGPTTWVDKVEFGLIQESRRLEQMEELERFERNLRRRRERFLKRILRMTDTKKLHELALTHADKEVCSLARDRAFGLLKKSR